MKRITALTGIVIALAVTAAPAAQAGTSDDVCQIAKKILTFRINCE